MARESDTFDEFYLAAAPRLVQLLYLATGDLGRAQDCTQEAFLRAWRRWDSISADVADPFAWVRRVAWRLAISDWRRAMAQVRALVRHGPVGDLPAPTGIEVAVRDALAQLSVEQRAAVVLHYFADLRVTDIAELLDVPDGTVKARLSRGRAALALLLRDAEEAL